MVKTLRWALLGIIVVLPLVGVIFGIKMFQARAMKAATAKLVMPPAPVNVAEVREELWQPRHSAVGSVMSVQGTMVSTEAEGIVREIKFEAGSEVKAGDELVQLDIDIEKAQLRAAEASAELTGLSLKRSKELIQSQSISQAELDSAEAADKQATAQVDNIRAWIAKKTVRAPFAGKLGIQKISTGQYLGKGMPVVQLHSLDPIYVEFSLPQQRLGDLTEGLKVIVTSDAYRGEQYEGTLTAINPEIDLATRNVRVQATMSNTEQRLRHGMFVSVEVVLARSEKVLFIPATAVLPEPFGNSILVIEEGEPGPDGKKPLVAQKRFVRLGIRQGDFVAVTEGAKAGERVVSTGPFKIQPGMPVVIDNALAPKFSFSPKPKNT